MPGPMNEQADDLMSGERVVGTARLHWMVMAPRGRAAICVLPALVPALAGGTGGAALAATWVAAVLLPAFLKLSSTRLTVTNKRILAGMGFFKRRSIEVVISKVASIEIEQSLPARALGYGSVTIRGTGGPPETFDWILRPFEFRRRVQEQLCPASPAPSSAEADATASGRMPLSELPL